jgi:hypothetical protein
VDAPRDSRAAGASGPPTLFGATPKPAADGDLKILSALQTSPGGKPPVRRKSLWFGAGAAALIAAGVGYIAWSQTPEAEAVASTPAAPATASSPAASAAAPAAAVAAAASASAPSASPMAALIENTPAEPAAAAPAPAAQAQAVALHPVAAAPAAPKPAPKTHVASAQPQHKAAAHKPHEAAAPAPEASRKTAASKDADVDLLEAMVAHVRGKNAAKKAQQAAEAGKP